MVKEDVIASLKADVLKSLAKKAGLSGSLTRKADLVKALGDYLGGNLNDFLNRLTDRERAFRTAAKKLGYVLPR